MKSNSSYPILAKEGWGIIGAAIFITLLVWWLIGGFISFIFFVLLVFVIQFFRDPPRAISQTPHTTKWQLVYNDQRFSKEETLPCLL